MTKVEVSDAEYHRKLEERYSSGDERNFDLWLGDALNSLFYPLCLETAETSLKMSKTSVSRTVKKGKKPDMEEVSPISYNFKTVLPKSKAAEKRYLSGQNILLRGSVLYPSLPVWTEDASIPEDLINTVILMIENIPTEEALRVISINSSTLIETDTTRGASGKQGALNTVSEGIMAVAESINISLGQLVKDGFPMDEEGMVEKLIRDGVPLQLARYLPWAELGHNNSGNTYIPNLLVLTRGKFKFNPDYQGVVAQAKARRRLEVRKAHPDKFYRTKEDYLKTHIVDVTSSTTRGAVCPLAVGNGQSGVAVLSEAFLHVFGKLREIRREQLVVK